MKHVHKFTKKTISSKNGSNVTIIICRCKETKKVEMCDEKGIPRITMGI